MFANSPNNNYDTRTGNVTVDMGEAGVALEIHTTNYSLVQRVSHQCAENVSFEIFISKYCSYHLEA